MNNRSLAQTLALLFGLAFLAVGVLGFIPGVTTDLGDIEFAGKDSPSELFGIFQVSILHNIVHLLFGIAGIALSRTTANALTYLLWAGVLHLVLAVALLGSWFLRRGEEDIVVNDRAVTPPPAP
jgi:hypothetical protein